MGFKRPFGSPTRRIAVTTALLVLAVLTLVSAAPAPAGTPPNRLDDNRGDFVVQTAVNPFVELPPLSRSSFRSRFSFLRRSGP